jgi:hypothetical protein
MKLDNKDIIKLIGFVAVTISMWYDLKTDLAVTKATVELRLNALENPKEPKTVASYQHMAILPAETKIEGE